MSVVSDIEIRLRADIARLQQDMTQARQAVGGAMTNIRNAVSSAMGGMAALGAALGVAAFANFIKGAIDAVDAIGDISPATGLAIKDIAGLQLAFQFGGLEAGEMEKTMIKLSSAIAKSDDSLAVLGVATRTATGEMRGSLDVLYDLADSFSEMENSTRRTDLAVQVFGKSGAMLLPMLENGSEGLRKMAEMADKLGLSFTEAGVEAAGQFNDSLDTIGLMATGIGRNIAIQLLPTLNSLVGSFVDLAIEGDGVRKMADVIGTGFKIIYTGAVAVGQAFDTVSSIIAISIGAVVDGFGTVAKTLKYFIEGEYAMAWKAADTGARATVANAKTLGGDMVRSWGASAKAIGGVWTGASGETVKALNAMRGAGKLAAEQTKAQQEAAKKAAAEATKAAKEAEDAATKQAEAYASLLDAVGDRIAATSREAMGLDALTESQKLSLALDKQLLAGKQDLTPAQLAYYRSLIDTLAANEALISSNKVLADSANEQRQVLADAAAERSAAREQQAEKELAAQRDLWSSIDKTAHDTFVSIFDGGKGAAERLRDTFKNIFFDWLYQMTIKKWIVQLQPEIGGGGGLQSMLSKASGMLPESVTSGMGNVAAMAAKSMPVIAAAVASYMGAKAIAGKFRVEGIGSALNLLGIAGGVINRAFGRGPKETTSQGITGSFGGDGFSGSQFTEWMKKGGWLRSDKKGTDTAALDPGMVSQLSVTYKAMKDSTTEFAAAMGLPTEMVANYSKQIKLVSTGDATKDQEALAAVLTEIGDELATRVVPNIAAFVREGETAATTLQRLAVQFQVVGQVLDALGAVGTASMETRDRLVTLAGGVEAFASQYEFFNQNFLTEAERIAPVQKMVTEQMAALGRSGITTTEQFAAAVRDLAASGALATTVGAETYAALMNIAPAFKTVADAAKAAADQAIAAAQEEADRLDELARTAADEAIALARTRRDLEIQVMQEMGDATGALAARRQDELAAAHESLRPFYESIYARQDERAAIEAATEARDKAAREEEAAAGTLRTAASAAFAALQRSIAAQKGTIQAAFDSLMAGIEKRIEASNKRIGALQDLQSALRGAVGGQVGMSRGAAQAQIGAALAIAKASGILPDARDLQDALRVVQSDAANEFASLVDAQRDQLLTVNQIEELSAITGSQLTIEQQTLQALVDQKTAAQQAYEGEMARLDGILTSAQSQLDAINGVNNSVLSLFDALRGFGQSVFAATGNATIGKQATVTDSVKIESLYNGLLGRKSDAGGMQFYLDAIKSGNTMSQIEGYFKASPEYKALQGGIYTAQQPGTMAPGSNAMLTELQTMNSRMEKIEKATDVTAQSTTKHADQFENSTRGGGPMLVEME